MCNVYINVLLYVYLNVHGFLSMCDMFHDYLIIHKLEVRSLSIFPPKLYITYVSSYISIIVLG